VRDASRDLHTRAIYVYCVADCFRRLPHKRKEGEQPAGVYCYTTGGGDAVIEYYAAVQVRKLGGGQGKE